MADEANAAAGLITGEQLEYVFNALYENAGGLSVDILLKLAGYYKWNTGKLLEAVCFYINCRQTVIRGEDLKAVCDARHEAAALKNRLRMVSDAFDGKCESYRQLDAEYLDRLLVRAEAVVLRVLVPLLQPHHHVDVVRIQAVPVQEIENSTIHFEEPHILN